MDYDIPIYLFIYKSIVPQEFHCDVFIHLKINGILSLPRI